MEKLFGEYLVKCKVLQPPESNEPAEESKEEAADPDMPEGTVVPEQDANEVAPFYPYE